MERKFIGLKRNMVDRFILEYEDDYLGEYEGIIGQKVKIKQYKEFKIICFENLIDLIVINSDSEIKMFEDFVDVTNNELYEIKNILNGSIVNLNIILEGGDGVGKTTLSKHLAQLGMICSDREVNSITKKMKPEVNELDRLEEVSKFLMENNDKDVFFLYITEEELTRRNMFRSVYSEYDKDAVIFQRIYLETYNELKHFPNLHLLNCDQKNVCDLTKEIAKVILNKEECVIPRVKQYSN